MDVPCSTNASLDVLCLIFVYCLVELSTLSLFSTDLQSPSHPSPSAFESMLCVLLMLYISLVLCQFPVHPSLLLSLLLSDLLSLPFWCSCIVDMFISLWLFNISFVSGLSFCCPLFLWLPRRNPGRWHNRLVLSSMVIVSSSPKISKRFGSLIWKTQFICRSLSVLILSAVLRTSLLISCLWFVLMVRWTILPFFCRIPWCCKLDWSLPSFISVSKTTFSCRSSVNWLVLAQRSPMITLSWLLSFSVALLRCHETLRLLDRQYNKTSPV